MRTFIAIEIPENIKQQMSEIQGRLKDTGIDASWPRPEGIHLTLKFLGEIPESQAPDIKNGLVSAVKGTGEFRIEIAGAGAFPNPRNARVVWLGLSGEVEKLNRLQAAVEDAMVRIGFEREDRPFKPHLTLARIKYIRSKERWLTALEQVKDIKLTGFDATAVSVMKSELKPTGAVYMELARIELR